MEAGVLSAQMQHSFKQYLSLCSLTLFRELLFHFNWHVTKLEVFIIQNSGWFCEEGGLGVCSEQSCPMSSVWIESRKNCTVRFIMGRA